MPRDFDTSEEKPLLSTSHSSGRGGSPVGQYSRVSAFLIFLFPAMGGLLFGYDIGATSAVITQLKSSAFSGTTWYEAVADSSLLQGVITSIGMLGAMLGSLTCFQIADDIGRRRSLILASGMFILGSSLEWYSGRSSFEARAGITVLICGRLVYGYGCGFAMHGAPACESRKKSVYLSLF
jgi:MFS family permease